MMKTTSKCCETNHEPNQNKPCSGRSLRQLACGEQCTIVKVPSNSYLASLGFRINKTVTVMAKGILNGPILCCIDGRNIALGQEVAQTIQVEY
ncbi:Fe2+ transport system protein FeoA [Tindallia magadiensis]|uniref:Fe2+ transport system protein FeoA n=1 Tax=Tindallia magadiensis TaxID=69895 RepID=A0A1I3GRY2_9FIRM|nr:FeoA family protein [Tindallia magadiensis]SFI26174.1 Fe2+ transport system protein FeoA [Tindallia magadiensis]